MTTQSDFAIPLIQCFLSQRKEFNKILALSPSQYLFILFIKTSIDIELKAFAKSKSVTTISFSSTYWFNFSVNEIIVSTGLLLLKSELILVNQTIKS